MKFSTNGWHKVSTDKTHTTMKNDEGHEIRILHGALSPKFRGQLAALPLKKAEGGDATEEAHDSERENDQDLANSTQSDDLARMVEMESAAKVPTPKKSLRQRFADGGSTSAQDSPDQIAADAAKPQAPVTINIGSQGGATPNPTPNSGPSEPTPEAASPPPTTSAGASAQNAPQPVQPPVNTPDNTQQTSAAPPPQQQFPAPVPMAPAMLAKQAYVQDKLGEVQQFQNDLTDGHITPKTYGQLMDKSTFGRLGGLFGMLAASVGSAVTHQPNIVMEMMNNEITRDLEAQKTSKSNAQNMYNLTSQRLTAEANAGKTGADTQAEIYATAKMHANQLMLHDITEKVKTMPPGPQQQQAQQALALMAQAINNDNYQMADRLYSMQQLMGPTGASADQDPEAKFQSLNDSLLRSGDPRLQAIAQDNRSRHIPGVSGLASAPVPQPIKDQFRDMTTFDNKMSDLISYAKQHEGSMSPSVRNVAMQKAKEAATFYGSSLGASGTEGTRNWLDEQLANKNPVSVIAQELLGNNARLKEIQDSNNMRRSTLLKSQGFHGGNTSQSSGGLQEGQTGTYKGRPTIVKNGKWVLK